MDRDDDRYARLRLIPWWDQKRLEASTVLVAGVGALGNEIAKNLALLGIGTLVIVDLDDVEISNLSRSVLFRASDAGRPKVDAAAGRLADLNPGVRIVPLKLDVTAELGLGWFLDADVAIGALDNREARMWLNRLARRAGTPWIDGGIQEIAGQVRLFLPGDNACYECGMTDADFAHLNLRYSCPGLKRSQIEEGKVPTTPTVASVIAGLQVQEALKILHGKGAARSTAWMFDGTTNHFYASELAVRDDCLAHETYPDPLRLPLRASDTTLDGLVKALPGRMEGTPALALDRDLVEALRCEACGAEEEVLEPASRVPEERLACPSCGEERVPALVHRVEAGTPKASRTLAALGVPPYDVVRLTAPGEDRFALLAGDGPGG